MASRPPDRPSERPAGSPPTEDDYAVPVSRARPPRMPGANRTMPPMPLLPSLPPPPPRRMTQEVEMSWVEVVDADLVNPELSEEELAELAAAESGPVIELEGGLPDPSPTEEEILAARAEVARREAAESEEAESMREEALAARQRAQDARDRELRKQRKAERERERLAEEAMAARRAEEKKVEARTSAVREGRPKNQLLDLSDIDDEIDFALESVLGPHLSYAPRPMRDEGDDKDKK